MEAIWDVPVHFILHADRLNRFMNSLINKDFRSAALLEIIQNEKPKCLQLVALNLPIWLMLT